MQRFVAFNALLAEIWALSLGEIRLFMTHLEINVVFSRNFMCRLTGNLWKCAILWSTCCIYTSVSINACLRGQLRAIFTVSTIIALKKKKKINSGACMLFICIQSVSISCSLMYFSNNLNRKIMLNFKRINYITFYLANK